MGLLAAAAVALAALIITPGYFFYFDVTPKAVVVLAAAALMCFGALQKRADRVFTALLALNILSLALSSTLSSNPALSWFGTNWRRYGAVTQAATILFAWLVLLQIAGQAGRIHAILRAIAIGGSISALYGIAQYFGRDPFLPASAYHIGEGIWTIVRPPSTFGYVSYFASWLAGGSLLCLALAAMETRSALRKLSIAASALMAIAMLLTGTRGAAAGWAVGLAVWGWPRINRRIAGVAVLLAAAGVAFYFSPAGWNLHSRARWFVEDPWGGARPLLWRDSLRMAAGRLPAGYGPEVFTATFPHYESERLAKSYPDFAHESPHNMFLDALVSQGLPGLLILVALCVAALRLPCPPWIRAALLAQIVAQQFIVFTIPTALLFYLTLSLAYAMSAPREAPHTIRLPRRGWILLAPVAAALLLVAVRLAVADRELELTKRGVDSSDLTGAMGHYQAFERWRLPGVSSDLWLSRALVMLAQKTENPVLRLQTVAESGRAAKRAIQTADDPFNAWYNMSALYASQNDARDTERSLRAAIQAHPNWFKPHWTLAQVLRLEGRLEQAEIEAAQAAELNGARNPEVAQTLADIRAKRATGSLAR